MILENEQILQHPLEGFEIVDGPPSKHLGRSIIVSESVGITLRHKNRTKEFKFLVGRMEKTGDWGERSFAPGDRFYEKEWWLKGNLWLEDPLGNGKMFSRTVVLKYDARTKTGQVVSIYYCHKKNSKEMKTQALRCGLRSMEEAFTNELEEVWRKRKSLSLG